MGLITGFLSLLLADAGTTAFVGNRVYRNVLPRDYTLPAIVLHRYGGSQDYDFNGPVGVREDQIQIDVYAKDDTEPTTQYVRDFIAEFVGALPGGPSVQACYLERDMDLPFLPNADSKGVANRSCLGFRVVSARQ